MVVNYEVKPKRKGEAERIGREMFEAFKLCFSKESSEKWVKTFGKKRFEMLKVTQYEDYGTVFTQNFENKVLKTFTQLTMQYIRTYNKKKVSDDYGFSNFEETDKEW